MTSQLEFTLPNHRACRSLNRPRHRSTRAAFWFQRIRQIVDAAADWPTGSSMDPRHVSAPTGSNRHFIFNRHQKCAETRFALPGSSPVTSLVTSQPVLVTAGNLW